MTDYVGLSEIKLKRTDTTLDLSQQAKRAKEERKEEETDGRRAEYLYCQIAREDARLSDITWFTGLVLWQPGPDQEIN